MSLSHRSERVRGPLVFALGVAAGCAFTLFVTGNAPRDARAADEPAKAAAPARSAATSAADAPSPLPRSPGTVVVDEGGATYTCTSASVEVLDATSSNPRLVLSAECPNGKRLGVVGLPKRVPGNVRVAAMRFTDVTNGEEWTGSDARLDVDALGPVGDEVTGKLDVTMNARLNEDPVHLVAYFRAPRAKDRSAP
jgi:hypothetical protein